MQQILRNCFSFRSNRNVGSIHLQSTLIPSVRRRLVNFIEMKTLHSISLQHTFRSRSKLTTSFVIQPSISFHLLKSGGLHFFSTSTSQKAFYYWSSQEIKDHFLHSGRLKSYLTKDVDSQVLLGRNVVNLSKEECQRYFGELGNVVYVLMEKMQQKSAESLGDALVLAAHLQLKELIKNLVMMGANVNHLHSEMQISALLECVQNGAIDCVTVLLELGANINEFVGGVTPLFVASQKGDVELVTLLIDRGANVYLGREEDGISPAFAAAFRGDLETIKRLIQHNYKPIQDLKSAGSTILHLAAGLGNLELVKYLIENKHIPIETPTNLGETALCVAAQQGKDEVVNYLLKAGANTQKPSREGLTPFLAALFQGHQSTMEILMQDPKFNINKMNDESGLTPLAIAVSHKHFPAIDFLLERGVDVDGINFDETTPLSTACIQGDVEVVEKLLKHGANVNKTTKSGLTPLIQTCFSVSFNENAISVVKILLNAGANLNQPTFTGDQAIHIACQNENLSLVKLLVDHGSEINSANQDKKRPLEIAKESKNRELVDFLIQHGAK
jgi:ankyrin repeat protein